MLEIFPTEIGTGRPLRGSRSVAQSDGRLILSVFFQEAKSREQSQLGNAEKQKIIMQISAVQTELVRMIDKR